MFGILVKDAVSIAHRQLTLDEEGDEQLLAECWRTRNTIMILASLAPDKGHTAETLLKTAG